MSRWLRAYGWLIGVLAVAAFAMLFRLGAQPIQNWDEGIHGAVSLEMVEDGDWLTPHYMGGTYFRKPPLKLWMSSTLFEWFGANAWTLRLPSALAGIATALLIAWWMWQWRRSRLEAFLAGVIVATMRPIFFHAFRTGEMDGLLTLFITASLYCWWRATEYPTPSRSPSPREGEKRRGWWWFVCCGAALGLGVMTKSAAGLLPIPIILAHAMITGAWRVLRLRSILLSVLTFSILAIPWHLAMTILHGRAFWEQYLGWHVVARVATALHNEGAGTWWYLPTFAQKFTPYVFWFVPAVGYIAVVAHRAWRQRGKLMSVHSSFIIHHSSLPLFLLVWFAVTLALFTIAKTKFDWYLLPLYPAAVMLLIPFIASARDAIHDRTIAALHLAAVGGFLLALPNVFPDGTISDRIIEQWYALFGHPLILTALALITCIGIIAAVHQRWNTVIASRTTRTLVLLLMLIPGLTVTARYLLAREPNHPATAIAAALRGTHGVLVTYGFDPKAYPAAYFILRTQLSGDVRILDGQSDVARTISMLREREHGFLLTQNEMELPEELRAAVADPRIFDDFTLWQRP